MLCRSTGWGGVLFPASEGFTVKSKPRRSRFTLRLDQKLWKQYRRFALRLDVPTTSLIVAALNFYAVAFQLRRRRK